MPFPLSTLTKIAQLVHSEDASQAVAEKVGMKKDAFTTLLEAGVVGMESVEELAASCTEQLQETYNHLTSETVLDWLNAVDATDALDTPEKRLLSGEDGAAKIQDQAEQATQRLADSATLSDQPLLKRPSSLLSDLQAREEADYATAEATLSEAADLSHEQAQLDTLREIQTTAGGSLSACTQQPFSVAADALPILFAVHSRQNDAYGVGGMGTSTSSSTDMSSSRVLNDTTAGGLLKNASNLYRLVTGEFANTTTLTSFYQEPHMAFLQGQHHVFGYQGLITRYRSSENVTNYPYAAVAVLELKNTNDQESTAKLSVEGSADSSLYGAGIVMRDSESTTWQALFSLTAPHPKFTVQVEIPLVARRRVSVMVVTTALALDTETLCHQFLSLNITGLTLGPGVIIDVPSVLSTTQGGV